MRNDCNARLARDMFLDSLDFPPYDGQLLARMNKEYSVRPYLQRALAPTRRSARHDPIQVPLQPLHSDDCRLRSSIWRDP